MTTTTVPTPSPVPVNTKTRPHQDSDNRPTNNNEITYPRPKLRLHLQDVRHSAAASFFSLIPDLQAVLDTALAAIVDQLYTTPQKQALLNNKSAALLSSFNPFVPLTRSVTVVLQDFEGVAYTNGTDLDDDHKEIHFSLSYINYVCNGNSDPLSELKGVLTHELVHCYQHNAPYGRGDIPRAPGGLIEGIADFVRLKAGLGAAHWQRPKSASERPSNWDAGYQNTAYFLAWLEDERIGRGAIGLLNDRLLRTGYIGEGKEEKDSNQPSFWKDLFGAEVADLWEEYGRFLDEQV